MEMKKVLDMLTQIDKGNSAKPAGRKSKVLSESNSVKKIFKQLSEATMYDEDIRGQLIDAIDEGMLDARDVVIWTIKYMGPNDVKDMLERNEALSFFQDEEIGESDEQEDWYDADGNNDDNGAYDAGGNYDAERDANNGRMDESDWDDDDRRDDEEYGGRFGSKSSRRSGQRDLERDGAPRDDEDGLNEGEAFDKINSRVSSRNTSTAMADVQARSQERPNYGLKAVKARVEGRSETLDQGEEELGTDDDIAQLQSNAGIEEDTNQSFANPQERHTWMMQELNRLQGEMSPEDAQMVASFMRKAGEADVRGGQC